MNHLADIQKMTETGLAVAGDINPVTAYLEGLNERSRDTMAQALARVARLMLDRPELVAGDLVHIPWACLRHAHVAAIRSRLETAFAPATVNHCLTAVRGVLKAAWLLGQMEHEDYYRAIDIKAVKGERLPTGRMLTQLELHKLFGACRDDRTVRGVRDGAIIMCLYGAGLRRAEVAEMQRSDYIGNGPAFKVIGKGNKERRAPLAAGGITAIVRWLEYRDEWEDGPMFVQIAMSGKLTPFGLSTQAIKTILDKRCKQAGIDHCTPHDLRRSLISDALDAGVDIALVQRWAGHASPTVTAQYDRRGDEMMDLAAKSLRVPWAEDPGINRHSKVRDPNLRPHRDRTVAAIEE